MNDLTLELRVDARGKSGEAIRTSDGDELDLFVRGFLLLAMGDLEPGDSASLSVTRVAA